MENDYALVPLFLSVTRSLINNHRNGMFTAGLMSAEGFVCLVRVSGGEGMV